MLSLFAAQALCTRTQLVPTLDQTCQLREFILFMRKNDCSHIQIATCQRASRGHTFSMIAIFGLFLTPSSPEFLEGPPDEDEARTEVLILSFSRTRTRPRVRYLFFRDRGRDEALASFFALSLGHFED